MAFLKDLLKFGSKEKLDQFQGVPIHPDSDGKTTKEVKEAIEKCKNPDEDQKTIIVDSIPTLPEDTTKDDECEPNRYRDKTEEVDDISKRELTPEELEDHQKTLKHLEDVLFKPARDDFISKTLPKFPIYNRIIFVLNSTQREIIEEDGSSHTKIYDDSEIKYDKINDIILSKPLYGDYNFSVPERFTSRKELEDVFMNIEAASIIDLAWLKIKCKNCGEEFTMTRSEVSFYLNRDLKLPKRCKVCRDLRKNK